MCGDCPICYESLDTRSTISTPCMHTFHDTCLTIWLTNGHTCPICRTTIGRSISPTSVLDFAFFEANHDLGQILDYGDI